MRRDVHCACDEVAAHVNECSIQTQSSDKHARLQPFAFALMPAYNAQLSELPPCHGTHAHKKIAPLLCNASYGSLSHYAKLNK
jgi:hypothetical protein